MTNLKIISKIKKIENRKVDQKIHLKTTKEIIQKNLQKYKLQV